MIDSSKSLEGVARTLLVPLACRAHEYSSPDPLISDPRAVELFKNFEDIKKRVPNLPDPKKAIEKRIWQELTEIERHNLFVS